MNNLAFLFPVYSAACDFQASASCGTCHQDGGGKGGLDILI